MKQKNNGTLAHIENINNANNLEISDNAKNREFTYIDMHPIATYCTYIRLLIVKLRLDKCNHAIIAAY